MSESFDRPECYKLQGILQVGEECCIGCGVDPSPSLNPFTTAARIELEQARMAGWEGGVPLVELLKRVNRAAEKLIPLMGDRAPGMGRVKGVFTERSFRHYQTLGCITAPEKRGRISTYGYRHFAQALLVRMLLWDRVPAERIAGITSCRGSDELDDAILSGGGVMAWPGGGGGNHPFRQPVSSLPTSSEKWRRFTAAPGVELHVNEELPPLRPAELRELMGRLEQALARRLR
jgi:hypothetical protein